MLPRSRRRQAPAPQAIADLGAIPSLIGPDEIIDIAFGRAGKVNVSHADKNVGGILRATGKLDSIAATVTTHCDRIVHSFPFVDSIHPFYRDLLEVSIDVERMRTSLAAVAWARDRVAAIASRSAAQIRRGGRVTAAKRIDEAYGRIASVLKQVRDAFDYLEEVRIALRTVPAIDPRQPTVVIAGAPNVGKSQLVRQMSSGKPVVAPYPFTTKELQLGHFTAKYQRFQVIDTPGLLDRPLEQRNVIEKKAILALTHLPTVVVFVIDPTGECGTELEAQERLLEELRPLVKAPFIAVENKADKSTRRSARLQISALHGNGIDQLKGIVVAQLLRRLQELHDAEITAAEAPVETPAESTDDSEE